MAAAYAIGADLDEHSCYYQSLFIQMINIISTRASQTQISGPYKVFTNLVKGLDKIGYPYVVNRKVNASQRLWIHDDPIALRYINSNDIYKVVGPNLCDTPNRLPKFNHARTMIILPSKWYVDLWRELGFTYNPLISWPVGIDTDEYFPSAKAKRDKKVLVYHKRRKLAELNQIIDVLFELHLPFRLIYYGGYTEEDYKELLRETSFIIWHDGSETQGIAMQEAMACDIPILVCDITKLSDSIDGNFPENGMDFPATACPYFDQTCGLRINDLSQLKESLQFMLDCMNNFNPRNFIIDNLSLEGQATSFIRLWEYWGLSTEAGFNEMPKTIKDYRPPVAHKINTMRSKLKRFLNNNSE
jgi:hypothetical protein